MNKKTGLRKDEGKSKARLIEELRAARRKIAGLERAKEPPNVRYKRAEEALWSERNRLAAVTRQMGAGLAVISKDYRTLWANETLKKIFGDIEGKICYSTYNQRTEICPECGVREVLRKGSDRIIHEQVGKDIEGNTIWSEIIATPIKDREGNITEVLELVIPITERKRTEDALRKSESNLRALAMELSRAEERERQRLALFLHDEIGQSLSLLRMNFGSLADAATSKAKKKDIQKARDILENVINQTHTLTFELSPPVLHQLGLEAAIEWAGEKISQDNGIEFTFRDDGMMKPLDEDLKALLFRCVRELMSNVVKHAKARRIIVSLKRSQNQYRAVVEDDGTGFDFSLPDRRRALRGFGLFSIRERLAAVGGTFEIWSGPGRGTRVTLSVPLKKEIPSNGVS